MKVDVIVFLCCKDFLCCESRTTVHSTALLLPWAAWLLLCRPPQLAALKAGRYNAQIKVSVEDVNGVTVAFCRWKRVKAIVCLQRKRENNMARSLLYRGHAWVMLIEKGCRHAYGSGQIDHEQLGGRHTPKRPAKDGIACWFKLFRYLFGFCHLQSFAASRWRRHLPWPLLLVEVELAGPWPPSRSRHSPCVKRCDVITAISAKEMMIQWGKKKKRER